jgi:hypothetical protein
MSENVLDAEPIEAEALAKLLESSKPIDLWVTYSLSLTGTTSREYVSAHEREIPGSASTGSDWEEVGLGPSLEGFERAHVKLCTPKRLKVWTLLAPLVDTSPAGGIELEALANVESPLEYAGQEEQEAFACDSLLVHVQEWGNVKINFELLNSGFVTQGTSEMKF